MIHGGKHYYDSANPHVRGWLESGDDSQNPPRYYARLHTDEGVRKVPRWNLRPVLRGALSRLNGATEWISHPG